MNSIIQHLGIVILAAGQSRRMTNAKQLLEYNGDVLINSVIKNASSLDQNPIIVVLGANANAIEAAITKYAQVTIVLNDEWAEGMASSIRKGLNSMLTMFPNVDGVLILVCDQPFLTNIYLKNLIALQKQTNLPIAASSYSGKIGTPAIFHSSVFAELLTLTGDTGARAILNSKKYQTATLDFAEGTIDIDTDADYMQLISRLNDANKSS